MRFLIVGAGLTGAVIARTLADAGLRCMVVDQASHVAGHCHTRRDARTGILVHCFGPHTLHSDNARVWGFLERFADIRPYVHRKQAWVRGRLYPFPINLDTINRFFGVSLTPEQASDQLRERAAPYRNDHPANFEEAALASVGRELYEGFFRGYTRKQWGRDPTELPAALFRRLPVRVHDDRNVFHHERQGQPAGGYTRLVENMLSHPNIELRLNAAFEAGMLTAGFDHLFYSGTIDAYFGFALGRLPYRTLDFRDEHRQGTFQSCGTVNYCDEDVPYTRVAEHKHFFPWEAHPHETIVTYEHPRECGPADRPDYPIHFSAGHALYGGYVAQARKTERVSFVGRLGTYRYLDMDQAIEEAMAAAAATLACLAEGERIPAFFHD